MYHYYRNGATLIRSGAPMDLPQIPEELFVAEMEAAQKEIESTPAPPTEAERLEALTAQVDDLTLLMADIVGGAM